MELRSPLATSTPETRLRLTSVVAVLPLGVMPRSSTKLPLSEQVAVRLSRVRAISDEREWTPAQAARWLIGQVLASIDGQRLRSLRMTKRPVTVSETGRVTTMTMQHQTRTQTGHGSRHRRRWGTPARSLALPRFLSLSLLLCLCLAPAPAPAQQEYGAWTVQRSNPDPFASGQFEVKAYSVAQANSKIRGVFAFYREHIQYWFIEEQVRPWLLAGARRANRMYVRWFQYPDGLVTAEIDLTGSANAIAETQRQCAAHTED